MRKTLAVIFFMVHFTLCMGEIGASWSDGVKTALLLHQEKMPTEDPGTQGNMDLADASAEYCYRTSFHFSNICLINFSTSLLFYSAASRMYDEKVEIHTPPPES